MELELTTKLAGTDLSIALSGELNTLTAPKLGAVLDEKLDQVSALHLDFAGCDFVSSAGLRVLLKTFKKIKAKKGTMEFTNIGPSFKEVLNITGLDGVFGLK